MKKNERLFEVYLGGQAEGKTYTLKRRVRYLAGLSGVRSVFILDRLNEFEICDFLGYHVATIRDASTESLDRDDTLPHIVLFQLGDDADSYDCVFKFAIEQGDCVCVLDEAYEFAPSGSTFRGSRYLKKIVYSGRHLPACDGNLRPSHLLIAAQYPKTFYHGIWQQARTINTTVLRGEANRRWIVDNFGADEWSDNQRLGRYQWQCLRGSMPRLGPHF